MRKLIPIVLLVMHPAYYPVRCAESKYLDQGVVRRHHATADVFRLYCVLPNVPSGEAGVPVRQAIIPITAGAAAIIPDMVLWSAAKASIGYRHWLLQKDRIPFQ